MAGPLESLIDTLDDELSRPVQVQEVLERDPGLSPADAYAVQYELMARRVARGDRIVGYKAALTSVAMQEEVGIGEPLLGTLLASRLFPDGESLSLAPFLKATLEPEIAVLLKADLQGPGLTLPEVQAAVEGYLPAVEIGDYRTDPKARSLQQSVVCNTFNGGIVLGGPLTAPGGIDLRYEGMTLTHNEAPAGSATGVEVLGDPLRSVAFMADKLAEHGLGLKAGMILMTGSIVRSIPLAAGDHVHVAFTRLGSLHLHIAAT